MARDYEILCKCCPLLITECATTSEGACSEAARWVVKQKVVASYFVLLCYFTVEKVFLVDTLMCLGQSSRPQPELTYKMNPGHYVTNTISTI